MSLDPRLLHALCQLATVCTVLFLSFYLVQYQISAIIIVNLVIIQTLFGFHQVGSDFILMVDCIVQFKSVSPRLHDYKITPPKIENLNEAHIRLASYNNLDYTLANPINIKQNTIVAIIGPSGSGKTSLLETIAGLHEKASGDIYFNDKNIKDLTYFELQNTFSICYHDADIFLDTLLFNITLSEEKNATVGEAKSYITKLMLETLQNRQLQQNTLSSGEKQRIGIARLLYLDRPVLLLDEPTSNLDEKTKGNFLDFLKEKKKSNIIICTTHDPSLIAISDMKISFKDN